jgi:hypothetical protein
MRSYKKKDKISRKLVILPTDTYFTVHQFDSNFNNTYMRKTNSIFLFYYKKNLLVQFLRHITN